MRMTDLREPTNRPRPTNLTAEEKSQLHMLLHEDWPLDRICTHFGWPVDETVHCLHQPGHSFTQLLDELLDSRSEHTLAYIKRRAAQGKSLYTIYRALGLRGLRAEVKDLHEAIHARSQETQERLRQQQRKLHLRSP